MGKFDHITAIDKEHTKSLKHLEIPLPSISYFKPSDRYRYNKRMKSQKAVTLVSGIDDIEGYILSREKQTGNKFLAVYDLPIAEREKVMQHLENKGITAASLFPDLDGTCKALKEKLF